jgi:hypothetical protein
MDISINSQPNWITLPIDTQYYDTNLRTAFKLENNIVKEWVEQNNNWIRSSDYTSWIPLSDNITKNPNYIAL